jgi:hypothetical protein
LSRVNFTTAELLASIAVSIASLLANHFIFLSNSGKDFFKAFVIKSGKHLSIEVNLIQGL